MNPRWPVFIPSKGRPDPNQSLTIKHFRILGIPFRVVVQPQEVRAYVDCGVDESQILELPFSSADVTESSPLVATRNWIWDKALEEGHEYFWTFDDNIRGLYRLNRNLKTPVADGTILHVIEDFAMRYSNLPLCGMNYFMFAERKQDGRTIPPFYLNNRVYSNGLIVTDYRDPQGRPYRNEGYFNDDTDLNLRIVGDGNCTVLFNAFLIYKMVTMTIKGGIEYQTSDVKEKDQRYIASKEIADKHPDLVHVTHKFGRWHHSANYGAAVANADARRRLEDPDVLIETQRLKLKPGVEIPTGVNNYGMKLERLDPSTGEWSINSSPWYPWEDGR